MRFRLGLVTGLATGYYLGARAGRQRYDQINRQLTRLKRSDAFEEATDRARAAVAEGVDMARSLVDRGDDGAESAPSSNGSAPPVDVAADLVVPVEIVPVEIVPVEPAADVTAEIIVVGESGTAPIGTPPTGTEGGGYSSSR
jgi:hypothetical protein